MTTSLLRFALKAGAKTKPWQVSTNPLLSAPFEFTKSILKDKFLLRNIGQGGKGTQIATDFIRGSFPKMMAKNEHGMSAGINALMAQSGQAHTFSTMGAHAGLSNLKPNMIIGMAKDTLKLKRLKVDLGKVKKGSKAYKAIVRKMDKIVSKEWHPRVRGERRLLETLPKVEKTLKSEYDIMNNRDKLISFQHGRDIQKIRVPKHLKKKLRKYTGGPNKGERFIDGTQTKPHLLGTGDHLVTTPGRHRMAPSVGERLRQAQVNAQPFTPDIAASKYKLSPMDKIEYKNYITKYLKKDIKDAKITDFDDYADMIMEARGGEWLMTEPESAKRFLRLIKPSSKQFARETGLLKFLKQAGIKP